MSHPQPSHRGGHPCTVDVLPGPTGAMLHPGCDIKAPTRAVGAVSCGGVVVRPSEGSERSSMHYYQHAPSTAPLRRCVVGRFGQKSPPDRSVHRSFTRRDHFVKLGADAHRALVVNSRQSSIWVQIATTLT